MLQRFYPKKVHIINLQILFILYSCMSRQVQEIQELQESNKKLSTKQAWINTILLCSSFEFQANWVFR